MHVIVHQTVRQHLQSVPPAVVLSQGQVSLAFMVLKEDQRAPIATLCDMVRHTRNYHARQASHATPCSSSAPRRQAPFPSALVVVCPNTVRRVICLRHCRINQFHMRPLKQPESS